MPEKHQQVVKKLILWYLEHKRDLPWREERDPYRIWLSEIILQQTRVDQGLPYYLKFIQAFPTIFDLAGASEEQILKLWQGLGYYSRARNLHQAAKQVVHEFDGHFPTTYSGLLQLKGVGDYTASAIASFCFGAPTAVVDGNVFRVLSRLYGIATPINSFRGAKEFKSLAQDLLDPTRPGIWNQAIMEFGAQWCLPRNPDCEHCVLKDSCVAYKLDEVQRFPVKKKAKKAKNRYFNYVVVTSEDDRTLLKKREGRGIWKNLYEFPLIEAGGETSKTNLMTLPAFKAFSDTLEIHSLTLYNTEPIVHKLSHQHLHTQFWIASSPLLKDRGVPFPEVFAYPVPVLISDFISEFFKKEET